MPNQPNIFLQYILPSLIPIFLLLVGYVFWWPQQKRLLQDDLRKETEKKLNEKKWEIYVEFFRLTHIMFMVHVENPSYGGDMPLETYRKIEEECDALILQILIVGSDSVIKALKNWREVYTNIGYANKEALELFKILITEVRLDLGYPSTNIGIYEITGCLIPQKKYLANLSISDFQ